MVYAPACSCKDCQHGCLFGSGVFIDSEIDLFAVFKKRSRKQVITEFLEPIILFEKTFYRPKILRGNKPYGKCIFFEKGICTIHSVKPLQCKLAMGCSEYGEELMLWFMLHYLIDFSESNSVKAYRSYLAAGGKTLSDGALDSIIPDPKKRALLLHEH